MSILTVLGLLMAVACVIALVQEGSDKATNLFAGVTLLIGLGIAGLRLTDWFWGHAAPGDILYKVLGAAALIMGLVMVTKLQNRVVGTLIATAGALFSAYAFHAIRSGV